MPDKYEDHEIEFEKIRKENKELLKNFKNWLNKKELAPKTIKNHIYNIDFYINEFLLYEQPIKPEEGIDDIGSFLGYWFIKKAMWATASSIKSNVSSLKKFYSYLKECGVVEKEELDKMNNTIKNNMGEWLETLRRYDDPSIEDMEEVWGIMY